MKKRLVLLITEEKGEDAKISQYWNKDKDFKQYWKQMCSAFTVLNNTGDRCHLLSLCQNLTENVWRGLKFFHWQLNAPMGKRWWPNNSFIKVNRLLIRMSPVTTLIWIHQPCYCPVDLVQFRQNIFLKFCHKITQSSLKAWGSDF